jgi:hypothetical protein
MLPCMDLYIPDRWVASEVHTLTHAHKHMHTHPHTHTHTIGHAHTDTHTMSIVATLATFHLLMSPLKVGLAVPAGLNRFVMLVTAAVFQSAIGPYCDLAVTGSVTHALAAAAMFALVMAVCAATCAGRKRSSARPERRCDRIARAHLHTSDTTCCNAAVRVLHRGATHNSKLQH